MDSSLDKGKRSRIFTFLASATGRLRKRPPTEEEANGNPEPATLWLGPCLISPFQESEQLAADASCYQEGSASGKWPTFEWSKAHRLHDIQSLCDACDKIDVSALIKRGSSIRLHNSLTALDRAARNCTLCSLICQSVRGVSGSRYEKDFLSTMGSRDARDSDSIPVYLKAHDGMLHVTAPFPEDWKGYGDQNGWHLGSFPIHHREGISTVPPPSAYDSGSTSPSELPGTCVPIKNLSQKTACDDGNSLLIHLRTQLRDVLASSCGTCMPTRTKSRHYGRLPLPTLPDRVVQILDSSIADAIELNLYTTRGTIKGHYVALSHRWGGQMNFKTTKNTLNQRLRGFALTELPRTFQDAVLVARALDIKFIWIDCLCIVQDDHRDWLQQSSKMGTIYRNAAYTIAAHSARQCNEGFLRRCQVPATLCINPRRGGPEFFVSIPDLQIQQIHRHFFKSEISQRAWVLQELTLSSKILHFVENRLIWECKHHTPEFRGWLEGVGINIWDSKHDGLPLETSAAIFRKADTKSGPYNAWLELVHQYSQYQMSNDGDKLVALAGLVEVLQDRIANSNERHYHCGVFQSDIERSLMWYGTKDGRHLARAPSWSWASSGGKVSFNILKVTESARCWIAVKSLRHQDYLDPSVIQPTCRLAIRGPVVHMNCVMGVEKSKGLPHTPPHIACDITTLNIVLDDECFNIGWAIEDETGIIIGSPHPSRTGKVQIAFLVVWGEGEPVIPFRAWGILMRPVGEQAGVYRRIGLAFVKDVEAIWEAVKSPEDFDLI